jgi:hypothetical protein
LYLSPWLLAKMVLPYKRKILLDKYLPNDDIYHE